MPRAGPSPFTLKHALHSLLMDVMKPLCLFHKFALLGLLLCGASSVTLAQSEIRIGGSDILGPILKPNLEALAESRGDKLKVQFRGSIIGIKELRDDNLDFAIIAVPRDSELPSESEYKLIPVGYFVVSIVVNNGNPLYQINIDQLASTLGAQEGESFANWGELGLEGLWQNRAINPALTENEAGLTMEILRHSTIGAGTFKADAITSEEPKEIVKHLQDDSAGIGCIPYGVKLSNLKVLQVAPGSEQIAFAPTEDNVYFGDYPLTLPFYIVARYDKIAKAKDYMKELLSNTTAELMVSNYMMPLPRTNRQQFSLELEVGR